MNSDAKEEINWTTDQRKIIGHKGGPMQVIACAGSGKTRTISRMIAEMVKNGVPRDAIVALAFNNNAADELKVKIRNEMDSVNPDNPVLGGMAVGTIHSFCKQLLEEHNPRLRDMKVLNKNGFMSFIWRHYSDLKIKDIIGETREPLSKTRRIEDFIEDVNTIRREMLEEALIVSGDEKAQRLMASYAILDGFMRRSHVIDFEGLIHQTIRLLEDDSIRREVTRRHTHFIVDEYQDIDPAHERLLSLLVKDSKNIVVVGDDDQAIYKWKGTRVESFLTFHERFNADEGRLLKSFRCSDVLVDISQAVAGNLTRRLPKDVEPGTAAEPGDVYVTEFVSEDQEIEFILDRIEDLVGTYYVDIDGKKRIIEYGSVAILYRKKADMAPIIRAMEARGVPFSVSTSGTIFNRPETDFVRYALTYFATAFKGDLSINHTRGMAVRRGDREDRRVVTEADLVEIIDLSPLLNSRKSALMKYIRERKTWFDRRADEQEIPVKEREVRRIYPQNELQNLLEHMGFGEEDFREPRIKAMMSDMGQVSSLLMDFESVYRMLYPDIMVDLAYFLDWAVDYSDNAVRDPTNLNAIRIMTLHSAKGLEFPVVFMPSTNRITYKSISRSFSIRKPEHECIPLAIFNFSAYAETEDDKRRLFYVGMTRSKKFLAITSSRESSRWPNHRNMFGMMTEVMSLDHPFVLQTPIADMTPRQKFGQGALMEGYAYPTSYSDIRYYLACPYGYLIRTIFGFKPRIDSSFDYGHAVHGVLKEIHSRFEEGGGFRMTVSEVQTLIDDPDQFHLRYAAGDVDRILRESAKKVLTDYVVKWGRDIGMTYKAEIPFEYSIHDEGTDGVALVSGKIDLLQKIDPETKKVEQVCIVDFKSGKCEGTEHDPSYRDAAFQVVVYANATEKVMSLEGLQGFVHYLKGKEDPVEEGAEECGEYNYRMPVDLSKRNLTLVDETIKRAVRRIMNKDFDPTSSKKSCGSCDFKAMCKFKVEGCAGR